jgi:four helix bundle protein
MDANDAVYAATRRFPRSEMFGLTSQLRRASSSVPMNIAEGYRRKARKPDYVKYLRYADGSSAEVETAMEIAMRQDYLEPDAATPMIGMYQEVGRMLGGLIARIEREVRDEAE